MTKRTIARLVVAVLIASMVGGTWLIVANYGGTSEATVSGVVH
jgi:hypothetical protein